MTIFRLPDLGEGLKDAEIVTWHVGAGDHVVADQPLVSVETDKAVVEVPAPQAGRIARLCAALHERVAVGAPLVEFEEGAHADPGAVVGELAAPPAASPATPPPGRVAPAGIKAAPAVRALAVRLGVDLGALTPSGPDGTVTRADVEAAAARVAGAEPLRGTRFAMAVNLARAGREVVPATVVDEVDVDAWRADEAVTVRLIRAVVAGCAAAPALNAWYDGTAMARRLHRQIDLGLAVDSDEGLLVPVLRDVGGRDAAALRQAVEAAKAAARARSLVPADLRGPTITLSNFGTLAGRFAVLTVVPPQVAILGAGRIAPRPVVTEGALRARRVLPLSLTVDHRVVTGGEAARFLAAALLDLQKSS